MNDATIEQSHKNDNTETSTYHRDKNEHFIEDKHFHQLIAILDEIYKETQVRPSLRKLVNLIIEKSDLNAIREQLINQYS